MSNRAPTPASLAILATHRAPSLRNFAVSRFAAYYQHGRDKMVKSNLQNAHQFAEIATGLSS